MAYVTKAADLVNGTFVAIKQMFPGGDEARKKDSINREYRALQVLKHPNIVNLLDAGRSPGGDLYLVLEWLDKPLDELIKEKGPFVWKTYYREIGLPILDAISFAQRKGWIHRDIKPPNILLTSAGVPKITDYGIARAEAAPRIGITFARFGSEPYTPPEPDDGNYTFARDCFSFAAVSVFCLSGKNLRTYAELRTALLDLDPSVVPREVFETALSRDDPAARQQMCSQLHAEIEAFEKKKQKLSNAKYTIYLRFSAACAGEIGRQLGTEDQTEVEEYLAGELNEAAAVDTIDVDGAPRFRIYTITWVLDASISSPDSGKLIVERATRMWASELERLRSNACNAGVGFSFGAPPGVLVGKKAIDELVLLVANDGAAKETAAKDYETQRVFRGWYGLLRARSDYETKRQSAIPFELSEMEGSRITVRAGTPVTQEAIGESRLVRVSSKRVLLFDIVDVHLDELTLAITFGNVGEVPRRGRLELNTFAQERAIDKQKQALDAVYYDRAASSNLKRLIASPQTAKNGQPVSALSIKLDSDFGDDKVVVLKKALALDDVMVVKGPPGTGKTRLIEELIIQYLAKNPDHRVLLSSQTHIALDNVLERLSKRNPDLDMVRVGRPDDPRISEKCRPLLLDYKLEAWAKNLRLKAESYLESWAKDHGINKVEADTALVADRLVKTIVLREQLEAEHASTERRAGDVDKASDKLLEETGSEQSAEITRSTEEIATHLAALNTAIVNARKAEEELRKRLAIVSTYGRDLSEKGEVEIREWISVLLGTTPDEKQYRNLVSLQEDWLMRVGKSSDFFAATLTGAKVVAGTCIGLAGIRGFNEVTYDMCIVDEASKATATEALVPMSRARKWILVGDPEQLPPFLDTEFAKSYEDLKEIEVRETLLDRFIRLLPGTEVAELRVQHRMVKGIGDLVSHCFYKDGLESARTKSDTNLSPLFTKPVVWLDTSGHEDKGQDEMGSSFANSLECKAIRETLNRTNFIAAKKKLTPNVAVMAGYVAQVKAIRDAIRDYIHEWTNLTITCNTVDSFQGQQADMCIYSVTRSNPEGRLGFLREKPRLNVALSRARDLLIVVGDSQFCKSAEGENPFRVVIDYIEEHSADCEVRPAHVA